MKKVVDGGSRTPLVGRTVGDGETLVPLVLVKVTSLNRLTGPTVTGLRLTCTWGDEAGTETVDLADNVSFPHGPCPSASPAE